MNPHQQSVNSLRDLHRLRLRLDDVQIQRAGGFYRARFHGKAPSVFGSTAEEAKTRLLSVRETYSKSRNTRRDARRASVRGGNHHLINYGGKSTHVYEVSCEERADKQ